MKNMVITLNNQEIPMDAKIEIPDAVRVLYKMYRPMDLQGYGDYLKGGLT